MLDTANHTIEITLAVSGSYLPAEPDVGVGAGYEDMDIEDILIEGWTGGYGNRHRTQTSILTGVDLKNPEVQKIIANIIAAETQAIDDALLSNRD